MESKYAKEVISFLDEAIASWDNYEMIEAIRAVNKGILIGLKNSITRDFINE